MAALNISLPKTVRDFVEEQVRQGGYSTPSEYVHALVRAEQKPRAEEELESLLLEGVKSGKPVKAGPEYWIQKRRKLTAAQRGARRPARRI